MSIKYLTLIWISQIWNVFFSPLRARKQIKTWGDKDLPGWATPAKVAASRRACCCRTAPESSAPLRMQWLRPPRTRCPIPATGWCSAGGWISGHRCCRRHWTLSFSWDSHSHWSPPRTWSWGSARIASGAARAFFLVSASGNADWLIGFSTEFSCASVFISVVCTAGNIGKSDSFGCTQKLFARVHFTYGIFEMLNFLQ